MRRMLHLSSNIEARNNFGRTAGGGVEFPTLNLRTFRPDKTVTQAKRSHLARAIEDACLAAATPASPIRSSHAQATQPDRTAASLNAPRAAATSRDPADIAAQPAFADPERLDGVNGKDNGVAQPKPGIVVIHSRAVFRDCFVRCLEISYRDHEIFSFSDIAEWSNSKELNAQAAAVVILVVESGDEFNAAGFEVLESAAADAPVIIVSDVDDLDHIVRTLKSGVRGYIPTSLPFNVAVEAVRLVKAGGTFVPASSLVHDRNGQQPALKTALLLTERQMEVLEEIRHGKANKQIAYELNMSEHTVKVHLRHIMRKLKARNRTEVAMMSGSFLARSKDKRTEVPDDGPDKDFQAL